MKKYYRVLADTFLWKAGAILQGTTMANNTLGYSAIEDIWDAVPTVGDEHITARIVEHPDNAKFFERVYPATVKGSLFKTKDQLGVAYRSAFKE